MGEIIMSAHEIHIYLIEKRQTLWLHGQSLFKSQEVQFNRLPTKKMSGLHKTEIGTTKLVLELLQLDEPIRI